MLSQLYTSRCWPHSCRNQTIVARKRVRRHSTRQLIRKNSRSQDFNVTPSPTLHPPKKRKKLKTSQYPASLPNRPFKMPIPITPHKPLTPYPVPRRPFRNLPHKIPHRNPLSPLNRYHRIPPPPPYKMQLLAGRLTQKHPSPRRTLISCRHARLSLSRRRERNAQIPGPGLGAGAAEVEIFSRRGQVDEDRGDGWVNTWEGAEEEAVVSGPGVSGGAAGGGVEVRYRGGGEERVRGEEELALDAGRGGYGEVEGARDALGQEEVALGEVEEDLFEEFGEGEGAGCCCWCRHDCELFGGGPQTARWDRFVISDLDSLVRLTSSLSFQGVFNQEEC
jgi:hypothetical protein